MSITATKYVESVEQAYDEHWGYIWGAQGETWTAAKQAALEKKYYNDPVKYADYREGAMQGKKWIGKRVIDCSGLSRKPFVESGIKTIAHGSNSQFKNHCSKTGKIAKGMKLPIGALIFTGNESAHNHVGVLVNSTTVCEAIGTNKGVIHTPLSNKKWTYYGLMKNVVYDLSGTDLDTLGPVTTTATSTTTYVPASIKTTTSATAKTTTTRKTLRRGAKGNEVTELQTLLAKDGSTLEIDGIFGIGTQSAVRSFQKRHGLVVDGIVGSKTWAALLAL